MKKHAISCLFIFMSLFTGVQASSNISYCISSTPVAEAKLSWPLQDNPSDLTNAEGWTWHDESKNNKLSYFESSTGSVTYVPELYESPCGYFSTYLGSGCSYAVPSFNKNLKVAFISGYEFGFGAPKQKKIVAFSPSNEVEFPTSGPDMLKYNNNISISKGVAFENSNGNLIYFDGKSLTPFSVVGLTKSKDGRLTWSIFNDPNSKRSFIRSTEASETAFLYEISADMKIGKITLPENILSNFSLLSTPKTKQTWIINTDGIYVEIYGSFEKVMHLPEKYIFDITKNIGYDEKGDIYFTITQNKSDFSRSYALKEASYDACLLEIDFRKNALFEEIH